MHPILISHNGIVLIELAFDHHPKNLLMSRELVPSMMLENEVGYGFTHRIDGVIQVLVYDLDNGEEVLLLFDEVLWGLLW